MWSPRLNDATANVSTASAAGIEGPRPGLLELEKLRSNLLILSDAILSANALMSGYTHRFEQRKILPTLENIRPRTESRASTFFLSQSADQFNIK